MPDIQTLTSLAQELERTVNWWNNRALFFVALTAVAAAGYLVTSLMASRRANELRDAQTRIIEAKDSDARRRQSELAQVKKKQDPRFIRPGTFKNALVGTAPHTVEILYPKENDEAFLAASHLAGALREVSGWSVSDPKPIFPFASTSPLPPMLAAGGQPLGITIRTNNLDGAAKLVRRILSREDFEATSVLDGTLPDKTFQIIVAPRL